MGPPGGESSDLINEFLNGFLLLSYCQVVEAARALWRKQVLGDMPVGCQDKNVKIKRGRKQEKHQPMLGQVG